MAEILTFETKADMKAAGYISAQEFALSATNNTTGAKSISVARAKSILKGSPESVLAVVCGRIHRVVLKSKSKGIKSDLRGRPKVPNPATE